MINTDRISNFLRIVLLEKLNEYDEKTSAGFMLLSIFAKLQNSFSKKYIVNFLPKDNLQTFRNSVEVRIKSMDYQLDVCSTIQPAICSLVRN